MAIPIPAPFRKSMMKILEFVVILLGVALIISSVFFQDAFLNLTSQESNDAFIGSVLIALGLLFEKFTK